LDDISSRFKLKRKNWKTEWTEDAERDLYGETQKGEEEEEVEEVEEEEEEEEIEEEEKKEEEEEEEKQEVVQIETKSVQKEEKPFLVVNFGGKPSEVVKDEPIEEDEQMEEELEDEEEEPSDKREKIIQQFDNLIQLIAVKVTDKAIAEELMNSTIQLMNYVVEDSDDEQEEEGEEETPRNFPVFDSRDDLTIIKDLIEEKDSKLTQEEKERKYTKFFVIVDRDPVIQEQRDNLPICAEEQPIMESILENDIVIICGETGSGKTTQVPQFLYEAGFSHQSSNFPGLIGVTQPRRVAAVSTSQRVAQEMNCELGTTVGYHVRYDNKIQKETNIKFMTDGILIQEIQDDPLLLKYSALLIDEAHERNINTDILIGWLSRFIPQRNKMAKSGEKAPNGQTITPLKLVIMSATLRVSDFTENSLLFKQPPPVINIKSRQYPVTVHFSKKTDLGDYTESCFKKVTKIHENLPNGGILIILTGKEEIETLCKKLKKYSKKKEDRLEKQLESKKKLKYLEDEEKDEEDFINEMGDLSDDDENDEEDEMEEMDDHSTSHVLFEDNIQDEEIKKQGMKNLKKMSKNQVQKLHILPLYSMLSPERQLDIFKPPPENSRLCVVSTNISETSLTIPGIRYIVDSGRVKDKEFDKITGISKFVVKWTSKASADQRSGRAGRTG
jgi:ATP-dependent RNA helicase DHX37/DHR1